MIMIIYALMVVSLGGQVYALICQKCIQIELQSSKITMPGIGKGCIETQCEYGQVCYGLNGELTADIGPITSRGSVKIQGCIAMQTFGSALLPSCTKADVKYVNMFVREALILMDGSNIQVDGYSCTCNTDFCDSICENGFLIANKLCVPKWVLGVTAASVAIILLLITCSCFCCCCCCCCRNRHRNITAPAAANPIIIVYPDQGVHESTSHSNEYSSSMLPPYEYIGSEDDAPLIKL